ncbi:MAG: winged helix-turn-helix transcriptional regulator [Thermoplasmatota archaeon]
MRLLHRTRKILLRFIRKNPGVSFGDLMSTFDLNKGTLRYHLRFLEKKGTIRSERKGRRKVFFHHGFKTPSVREGSDAEDLGEAASTVLEIIEENPGVGVKGISGISGMSKKEIRRCISFLRIRRLIWKVETDLGPGYRRITRDALKDEMMLILLEKLASGEIDEVVYLELKERIRKI